ncbi:class I SAM-dependent methyltransferase [Roseibium sp.]|uniref:class I SAM-dependent methyltransferase n=1 Tax=Roseibium sp. TaxID=1936156 RepID=UPI003BB02D26
MHPTLDRAKRRDVTDAPEEVAVHSEYLVKKLSNAQRNLYGTVKFDVVSRQIRDWAAELDRPPRILDIGCSTSISRDYLAETGLEFDYCGADYEAAFEPDIVLDATRLSEHRNELPWRPDVITLLDVLEHLPGQGPAIESVMRQCGEVVAPGGLILAVVPQLYRLDRLKLKHLHYPEHHVRMTLAEWSGIIARAVTIEAVHGVGYLSCLPYLPMFSPWYEEHNRHGKLFHHLRGKTFEWGPLKPLEKGLTRSLGRLPGFRGWCNSSLLVCRAKG